MRTSPSFHQLRLLPLLPFLAGLAACAPPPDPSGASGAELVPLELASDNRAAVDGFFVAPAASSFVLKPGTLAAVPWRYTIAPPSMGWEQPAFNPSPPWASGSPGFSGPDTMPGDVARTSWLEGVPEMWLRTTFSLASADIAKVVLWGRWDDTVDVYLNGVRAVTEAGWSNGYRYLGLSAAARAALRSGTNTIAVHVTDSGGGRYFDLGVTRNATLTSRPVSGFQRTSRLAVYANEVRQYMVEHGIPAGVISVMKKNVVVVSKGIGWTSKSFTTPLPSNAVMRIASNDKQITLAAIRLLLDSHTVDPVTHQVLTESTPVFPLLVAHGLTPIPGRTPDPAINQVTVLHLMRHVGGLQELPAPADFYRDLGGVAPGTSKPLDTVRWVYSMPLEFPPGQPPPDRDPYSSAGYMVLRHLVQVCKGDLLGYLRGQVLRPVGTSDVFIAHERLADRLTREPWYATLEAPMDRWIYLEDFTALAASSEALVRFMRRYDLATGNRLVNPVTGQYDPGPTPGAWMFGGGYTGTTSMMLQRQWDQVSIAVIFDINGTYNDLIDKLEVITTGLSPSDWGL